MIFSEILNDFSVAEAASILMDYRRRPEQFTSSGELHNGYSNEDDMYSSDVNHSINRRQGKPPLTRPRQPLEDQDTVRERAELDYQHAHQLRQHAQQEITEQELAALHQRIQQEQDTVRERAELDRQRDQQLRQQTEQENTVQQLAALHQRKQQDQDTVRERAELDRQRDQQQHRQYHLDKQRQVF